MSTGTTGTNSIGSGGTFAQSEEMSAVLAQNWWAVALRGIFAILFGIIALLLPGATMLSLVIFFAAYMLVDGAFAIVSAVRAARRRQRWGLLVFEGIFNIVAGVIAFLWPGITVLAFVLLVGASSLLSGGFMFAAAFRLRRRHGRWWLALSGLLSLLFGLMLIVAPLIGAVVLTWWIGIYALVLGGMLLGLAFQLRSRHTDTPHGATLQGA